MFSRNVVVLLLAAIGGAQSQSCKAGSGCTFEPFNPVACGPPDYLCAYDNPCLAGSAGFTVQSQCCQAPQPSACPFISEPVLCGDQQCPYANKCLAGLAGYSDGQCSPIPPECPKAPDETVCSGQPANPIKCGQTSDRTCQYENYCLALNAGFNIQNDCCQDVKIQAACPTILAPVSCGPPGGKQCIYNTQCEAGTAGYNDKQCCPSVPTTAVCQSISAPVTCGGIPCWFSNQCEATAAGFKPADCCPEVVGVCTLESDPYECGSGPSKCEYSGLSCAVAAGWTEAECCKKPNPGQCTNEFIPHTCGQIGCVYDNACLARLAGFDPNSCVKAGPTRVSTGDDDGSGVGNAGKAAALSMTAAAALFPLL